MARSRSNCIRLCPQRRTAGPPLAFCSGALGPGRTRPLRTHPGSYPVPCGGAHGLCPTQHSIGTHLVGRGLCAPPFRVLIASLSCHSEEARRADVGIRFPWAAEDVGPYGRFTGGCCVGARPLRTHPGGRPVPCGGAHVLRRKLLIPAVLQLFAGGTPQFCAVYFENVLHFPPGNGIVSPGVKRL